jgi:hypothetical protein
LFGPSTGFHPKLTCDFRRGIAVKVACFVNPLVHARGPCFNYGWVEAIAKLLQSLRQQARCDCMLIAGGWFPEWAAQNEKRHLLTGLRTVWLDELFL